MNASKMSLTGTAPPPITILTDTTATSIPALGEEPSTIAIVSASRLLSEGLSMALGRYVNVEVVASYDGELLPGVPAEAAEIALIDGNLGRQRVFSWLNYWRLQRTPSLVVELPNDPRIIVDYLQGGASAYCLQGTPVIEVALAVRNMCQGINNFSPEVNAEICYRLWALGVPASESPPQFDLTPREVEVLRCIAAGMSNQEIADSLVIHILTVKHHVHHILKKLNLSRRWDAARFALEAGLTNRWSGDTK